MGCGCAHDPLPELYAYPPGDPAGSRSYPWTYPYLFSPPLFRENCSNLDMNLGCYRAIEKMPKFPTWYRPNDSTIRVVSSRFPRCPDGNGGYFPNGYIWSGASGEGCQTNPWSCRVECWPGGPLFVPTAPETNSVENPKTKENVDTVRAATFYDDPNDPVCF